MLHRRGTAWLVLKPAIVVSACLGLAIFFPIRQLLRSQALFYGGQRDFYHDTLVSLAKYTAYTPHATREVIVALNLVVALVLSVVCVSLIRGRRLRDGHSQARTGLVAAAALLGLAAASTVAQHHLLGTPYLIDRTALFFYPIAALAACLGLLRSLPRPGGTAAVATLAAAAAVNLIAHANFQKTAMWSFDGHSREILQVVNDAGAASGRVQGLEFAWPFEQSIRYELARGSFPFVDIVRPLYPVDQTDFNPAADYYVYLRTSLENFDYDPAAQKAVSRLRDVVICFDAEATCLYRMR